MTESLRFVAGAVLVTALAVAPLNYGSTRLFPLQTLMAMTGGGAFAWLTASCISRTFSLPPLIPQLGVTLIAISASVWLLVLPLPELPQFTARHLSQVSMRWPYSVVPRNFGLLILWTACAVAAFFALVDFARQPVWRNAIAGAMLLSGGAVSLLGLLQNSTHARGIYWDDSVPMPGAFFGPFFHHTSAGAYLNTVWPLGFAIALRTIRQESETSWTRRIIYGALVCSALILAAHTGHISRLPQVLAVLGLIGFVFWAGAWRAFGKIGGLRVSILILAVALGLAVLGFGASRVRDISSRWDQLEWKSMTGNRAAIAPASEADWPRLMRADLFVPSSHGEYLLGDRGAAYATAWAAIKARPWLGWGPGGWTAAAAAFSSDPFIRTFFLMLQFTHSDYLQTCVEWGVIGALGWALLIPGAVVNALKRLQVRPSSDFIGAAAAVSLVMLLLQSTIDFPLQIPAIQFNAIALCALAWTVPGDRTSRGSAAPFLIS